MLEVRDLRKSFSGFTAVDGVSFDVPAQGITAVIGPNGAGKSTLFNLLTGHIRVDAGRVSFKGSDITGDAPHRICRMGVGRSFQHTNIFRKLTVFENVQAALIAHGGSAADFWSRLRRCIATKRSRFWARLALLARHMRRRILSPGNQKQLELGIALASDPELLLLDEPTAGMSAAETRDAYACLSGTSRNENSPASHRRTTWMWCFRSRKKLPCCIRGGRSPREMRPTFAAMRRCAASISEAGNELASPYMTFTPPMAARASCSAFRSMSRAASASVCWAATASASRRRCARSWD